MQAFFILLYTIWAFLCFVVVFTVIFTVQFVFLQNETWKPLAHRCSWLIANIFFVVVGMPLSVRYEFKPQKRGCYVFVANHFSYLDIVVVSAVIKNYFAFVGKSDVKNIPLLGYMFAKLHVQVNRADPDSRSKSLQKSFELLEGGRSIMLYPEGGIKAKNPPQMFEPFKDGAFLMAIKYQLPIVPISQLNNHKRLADKRQIRLIPGKVRVVVHEPISTIGLSQDDIPALREQVFKIIQDTLNAEGE